MIATSSDRVTDAQINGSQVKRQRLLAVVDGSERTNHIVDFIVAYGRGRQVTEVVILNVQATRDDARLRGYQRFKEEEIKDRLINDRGYPIVNNVSKRLQAAGITCLSKVAVGDPFAMTTKCAVEHGCDVILVAQRTRTGIGLVLPRPLRTWIEARFALKLIAHASTSVIVVK